MCNIIHFLRKESYIAYPSQDIIGESYLVDLIHISMPSSGFILFGTQYHYHIISLHNHYICILCVSSSIILLGIRHSKRSFFFLSRMKLQETSFRWLFRLSMAGVIHTKDNEYQTSYVICSSITDRVVYRHKLCLLNIIMGILKDTRQLAFLLFSTS